MLFSSVSHSPRFTLDIHLPVGEGMTVCMCGGGRGGGAGGGAEEAGVWRKVCVQILTDYRRNSRERPSYCSALVIQDRIMQKFQS